MFTGVFGNVIKIYFDHVSCYTVIKVYLFTNFLFEHISLAFIFIFQSEVCDLDCIALA